MNNNSLNTVKALYSHLEWCQFLIIKKPSIRLIMQINYKNDPLKMMNLRIDTLAQLLNNVNLQSGGKYMVYETGCQGNFIFLKLF